MADAIYAEFKYGEQKYGGTPDPLFPFWVVQIDWNNDGQFIEPIESDRCISIEIRRGRDHLFESAEIGRYSTVGTGFASVEPGEATIVLNNDDGRYDPWNTSSPLYPMVMPGRLVRLSTSYQGVMSSQFTGRIRELAPIAEDTRKLIRIKAYDGVKMMGEQNISVDVKENISAAAAFGEVMTAAGWAGQYQADAVPIYLRFFWGDGITPREMIMQLEDATLSRFYIDKNGTARFKGQYSQILPTMTFAEPYLLKTIKVAMPWEIIYNRVVVQGRQLSPYGGTTVIYTLGDKPYLAVGQEITLWCSYQYNGVAVPALSALDPVTGVDLKGNTVVDGSGTDLSASLSVNTIKLAGRMKVTIKNNSLSGGYITLLQIRGTPILAGDELRAEENDLSSQATFGVRELQVTNPWIQSLPTANTHASFLIKRTVTPQKMPVIRLQNQPALQYGIELYDPIQVDLPTVGIEGQTMVVGYIEHQSLDEGLKDFVTTIMLEPAGYYASAFWTFDTQLGVTSIFA